MSFARLAASTLSLVFVLGAANRLCAEPASANGNAATRCQSGRGALAFAGCSLAEQLGESARSAGVTIVQLKSDRELPAAEQLRQRIQAALEAALQTPSESKARAGKLSVELSVEKVGGVLRFSADLRRSGGFWQRLRHQRPRPEQHAFVEVALDAELRALIPPPPLVVSQVLKVKAPERGIVALACGPLGPDGGQELALVSRSHVRVGRIVQRAFAERQKVAWATLSPVAPVPLREPVASAEITAEGALRVGLSDRRDGLELGPDLSVRARSERAFPAVGGVDAIAEAGAFKLGREAGSTKLISLPSGDAMAPLRVGAQLAVGDADSDGRFELAYSADTLEAAKDRLTLVTLEDRLAKPRFELPAPGISAIAICKREGAGMAPLVVAAGDELWLIQ
jgi:hypothetical protein